MGIALPFMLALAIGLILLGSFVPEIIAKILIMSLGYSIILFIRDPFSLYIQDMIFDRTPKEQHQTLLTLLSFGTRLATAGLGLGFSAILLKWPLAVVMAIMLIIAVSVWIAAAITTAQEMR